MVFVELGIGCNDKARWSDKKRKTNVMSQADELL